MLGTLSAVLGLKCIKSLVVIGEYFSNREMFKMMGNLCMKEEYREILKKCFLSQRTV
jgi:hypothetical protein